VVRTRMPGGGGGVASRGVPLSQSLPLSGHCPSARSTASLGGYLLLAPGVSTVRYPIPQRTFKYVATVQSVTDETCHNRILLVDPTLIDPEMQDCNPVSLNRNNRASFLH
jgi:hypothetical protein